MTSPHTIVSNKRAKINGSQAFASPISDCGWWSVSLRQAELGPVGGSSYLGVQCHRQLNRCGTKYPSVPSANKYSSLKPLKHLASILDSRPCTSGAMFFFHFSFFILFPCRLHINHVLRPRFRFVILHPAILLTLSFSPHQNHQRHRHVQVKTITTNKFPAQVN